MYVPYFALLIANCAPGDNPRRDCFLRRLRRSTSWITEAASNGRSPAVAAFSHPPLGDDRVWRREWPPQNDHRARCEHKRNGRADGSA